MKRRKETKRTSNIKEQTAIDQTLGLVIKRISYIVKTKFLLAEQSGLIRVLERFSIECRKTKTKVITTAN